MDRYTRIEIDVQFTTPRQEPYHDGHGVGEAQLNTSWRYFLQSIQITNDERSGYYLLAIAYANPSIFGNE